MNRSELVRQIRKKNSFLCVGLDSDIRKIPAHLQNTADPVFEFNKQIIDATADFAVAYKPNIAFYESEGSRGWESLQKTMEYIPSEFFTIADAKRGDIGNTSTLYARAFFENMNFDSITVAPYMGSDSVLPFLEFEGKWVILLALTSNPGAADFQTEKLESGEKIYQKVLKTAGNWAGADRMMFVTGATRAEELAEIRKIVPDHFLLVPGVGAQGGDLESVARNGMNTDCGLLVNSSRGIIFADSGQGFAAAAGREARKLQEEMEKLLDRFAG